MRCLALAAVLRERGITTPFVCRSDEGNLNGLVLESGHRLLALPAQAPDAGETIAVVRGERPAWLVVDHYDLDAEWERQLRPHVESLLVISDLVGPQHECDALLNQNPSIAGGNAYDGQVPTGARVLLGPRYALLRRQFARRREMSRDRDGRVRRVLVYFGGTDPTNMTGLAIEALSEEEFDVLEVDVVVGTNNPHRERLAEQANRRARTRMHWAGADMPELMDLADLAIGAGGTTTLERLCLGLPSIVVSIAKNQEPSCEALAHKHLIVYLGVDDSIDVLRMRTALRRCAGGDVDLLDMSVRGRLEVDGRGAERVAEYLTPTPPDALHLRPAGEDDAQILFDWVNDPEVRRQSLDSKAIDWACHCAWFRARLASGDTLIHVLEAAGVPVGQIRFDGSGGRMKIDYSIDRTFRGRGWAKRLVTLGLERMRNAGANAFDADVKATNEASIAVFEGLGFSERSGGIAGMRVFSKDG